MSIENPEIGEIKRGYELDKGINNCNFYQWKGCIECNMPNWKIMKYGKIISPKCSKCAHASIIKNRIFPKMKGRNGFAPINRPLIDHKPILGEIRYADEIGYSHSGRKYIWHACELCGKERWVSLVSNKPQNTKCGICAKTGSIRHKSLSPTRKCSKCDTEYPATTDYFYRAKRSHKGISRTCKWCRNKQNSQLAAKRKNKYIAIRLHCNVSSAIRRSLKGERKGNGWENLVGYTKQDLMIHLESLFIDGMSWNNYGRKGWVIDHIIPKSAFCFRKPTDIDFKRCWELNNLQPMWFNENSKKNNFMDKPFQPSLPITIYERRLGYAT